MTSLGGLCAAPVVPGLALLHIDCCSPLLRSMPTRVGEAYSWPGASRTQDEWDSEILAHPLREYWLITQVTHERDAAGVAYLEPQPGGNMEIVAFGLLSEYVGKGLGGYALTLALRQAWAVESVGFEAVRRTWLHTSSDDHPNALRNYQKRGLRRIAAKPGLGRGCRKLTVCVSGRATVIADQSPLIRTTNRVRGGDVHARC
jgi:GNAT superfamily N-acetyltransferase